MSLNRRFSLTGSLRNLFSIAILIFFSSSVFAQVHGVPASVTSLGGGHGFHNPPGVPASVTSLGPRGFAPRFNGNRFDNGNRFNHGNGKFGRERNFGFGSSFFVPSGILPVYVSPYDYSGVDPNAVDPNTYNQNPTVNGLPMEQSMAPQGPQTPTVIVIDNRGVHDATNGYQAALAPVTPAPAPAAAPAAVPAPAPEQSGPKAVVVFRNGTRVEIQNYAIMGKELIDLSGGRMRRYPLDDVDVKATTKENNDRGVDFRLPQTSS